jgi:DNA-binding transcriptional MerR regulator
MEEKYSMRKMSQIVDVSIAKLKQWFDDGFIIPDRAPLGYFRYNQKHIDFIKSSDFSSKLNDFYNKKRELINE